MEKEFERIYERLVRLDEKLDNKFDSFAAHYMPRNELKVIHENSDKERINLSKKVAHIDSEVAEVKKQVANITTTFRNYAVVAGFVLAIVQTLLTTMLVKFVL